MKTALFLLLLATCTHAAPEVREIDWQPACEGSTIEVVSDHAKTASVSASAYHSTTIIQWTVHYVDGMPSSAEYREYDRGRIEKGDKAGDYSGVNRLKRIATFKGKGGGFDVSEKALHEELAGILAKVAGDTPGD